MGDERGNRNCYLRTESNGIRTDENCIHRWIIGFLVIYRSTVILSLQSVMRVGKEWRGLVLVVTQGCTDEG
jgi:hypothetical protein